MKFEKWHGAGNDFVMIDNFDGEHFLPPEKIRKICDRRFGVGADAVIFVEKSKIADAKMNYWNADGTPAETCGNGLRATAGFLRAKKYLLKNHFFLENPAGKSEPVEILRENPFEIRVSLGAPAFDSPDFREKWAGDEIEIDGKKMKIWTVSMGNPHAVQFVENVDAAPVLTIGPKIERHPNFPNRANAEFLEIVSEKEGKLRVFERGCGETFACGSGAAAAAVAGILAGKFAKNAEILLHLRGGDLRLFWDREKNLVFKIGPAEKVFSGKIEN